VLEIIHGRRLTGSLIGPPLLDDSVVDDRTRHHAPSARMDGWWAVAAGTPRPHGERSERHFRGVSRYGSRA